jgi:hypothetical protein
VQLTTIQNCIDPAKQVIHWNAILKPERVE